MAIDKDVAAVVAKEWSERIAERVTKALEKPPETDEQLARRLFSLCTGIPASKVLEIEFEIKDGTLTIHSVRLDTKIEYVTISCTLEA